MIHLRAHIWLSSQRQVPPFNDMQAHTFHPSTLAHAPIYLSYGHSQGTDRGELNIHQLGGF